MTTLEKAAHDIGAKGSEPTEAERLAFESWMRGHCWKVEGSWDGKQYVHAYESTGFVHGGAMDTRRLWAAWRDRGAVARVLAGQAQAVEPTAVSNLACNHEWVRSEQDQPWLVCEKCGLDYSSNATTALKQAQAGEPVGVVTFLPGGVRPILSRLPGARLNSGDKLYTHPAPPPPPTLKETLAAHGIKLRTEFDPKPRDHVEDNRNMVGERAKVGDSRFESWYSESAISHERKQAMREAYEAGLNEAQQVAVPTGCHRSHPHEEMTEVCQLKTEIAQLKAAFRASRTELIEVAAWLVLLTPLRQMQALDGLKQIGCKQFGHAMVLTEDALKLKAIEIRRAADALVTKPDSRPQNCGTGHCSCIECPYPKTDWRAA